MAAITTSSRLRGNTQPIFKLAIDGAAAVDYSGDLQKVDLKNREKDAGDLTFYEAAQGQTSLCDVVITLNTSFDASALYGVLWGKIGKTAVLTWGPYGNAAPTVTQPHFEVTVKIPPLDFGNEAKKASDTTGRSQEITMIGQTGVTLKTA